MSEYTGYDAMVVGMLVGIGLVDKAGVAFKKKKWPEVGKCSGTDE